MITLKLIKHWQDMINKVTNCDCLDAMKLIEDNAIDLVLTDPPYGIGANNKGAHSAIRDTEKYHKGDWDNEIPKKEIFEEMFRISKNQVIWGGNYFVEYLKNSQCWFVWNKMTREFSLADAELAWTSFNGSVRIFDHCRNIPNREHKKHPTQKPLELFKWIIEKYSEPDHLILDCFLGSGTTMRACKDLGRDCIGIEKEIKYCEIAEKRLQQQNLF